MTAAHSGKLLLHLLALDILFQVFWSGVEVVLNEVLLAILNYLSAALLIILTQVICFVYFRNTRGASNREAA